jgi:hypothetical protein
MGSDSIDCYSIHNRQVEGSSPSRPTIFSHLNHPLADIFAHGPTDYKSEGREHRITTQFLCSAPLSFNTGT